MKKPELFPACAKPRIAVLALSLDLYRSLPGYFDRLRQNWQIELDVLKSQFEITGELFATDVESVKQFCRKAPENNADAIVVAALSYAASQTALDALANAKLPVVIWNTQFADSIEKDYQFDDLLMNHTVQGIQDLTNCLYQRKRSFFIASGHYKDAATLRRLKSFLAAAEVFNRKKNIPVLELGGMFHGMCDFEFDRSEALKKLHYEIISANVNELQSLLNEVTEDDVKAARQKDLQMFKIQPNMDESVHLRSAKMHCAIRRLIEKYHPLAFTMNFSYLVDCKKFDVLPFLGINHLMAEGMGYAGEGDILRAGLMAEMRLLTGSANFTEIYTIDFKRNRMLMCHMQECNFAWAKQSAPITLLQKKFWAPGMGDYAGLHFTLEAGEVTLVTLTPNGKGSFNYIAFVADIVDMEALENFDIPHWLIEPRRQVNGLLDAYSENGGCHHLIAVRGDCRLEIAALCKLRGLNFTDITL